MLPSLAHLHHPSSSTGVTDSVRTVNDGIATDNDRRRDDRAQSFNRTPKGNAGGSRPGNAPPQSVPQSVPQFVPESEAMEIDTMNVHESNASKSHADEYQMDIMKLAQDYLREYNTDYYMPKHPGKPPLVLASPTISDDQQSRIANLGRARNATRLARPVKDDDRYRWNSDLLSRSKPLGLSEGDFVRLVNTIRASGANFWFWAFPVSPSQGQWANSKNGSGVFMDIPVKGVTDNDSLNATVNAKYANLLMEHSANMKCSARDASNKDSKCGSFNAGIPVSQEMYTSLFDAEWLDAYSNMEIHNDSGEAYAHGIGIVLEDMSDASGLWFRTDLKPPVNNESLQKNDMEMMYMLTGALMGVSAPVYAAQSSDVGAMAFVERALGDLSTPQSNLVKIDRSTHPTDKDVGLLHDNYVMPIYKEPLGEYIGNAYSALTTRLGELYVLVSDNKPANMLFQPSYQLFQVFAHDPDNPDPNSSFPICSFRFPACVLVTDLDPVYSAFVPERGRSVGVDSECIRFANAMVFGLAAGCHSYDFETSQTSPYTRYIMNSLSTQMLRYASSVTMEHSPILCRWFFNPSLVPKTMFKIHGRQGFNSSKDPLYPNRTDLLKRSVLRPSTGRPSVGVDRDGYDEFDWKKFFSSAAMMVVNSTRHYGYRRLGDGGEGCSAILEELSDLTWETFKEKLYAGRTGEEIQSLTVHLTEIDEERFPPFAIVVALIIAWANHEMELARDLEW